MKANELMIGDWAIVHGPADKRFTRKLDIGDLSFFVEFEPIPLTSEILEKNGFRWTGSGDSTMMFFTPWGYDGIRYTIYVGLKKKTIEVHSAHPELRSDSWRKANKVLLEVCGCYVHELQHCLKLCGIEKDIII